LVSEKGFDSTDFFMVLKLEAVMGEVQPDDDTGCAGSETAAWLLMPCEELVVVTVVEEVLCTWLSMPVTFMEMPTPAMFTFTDTFSLLLTWPWGAASVRVVV